MVFHQSGRIVNPGYIMYYRLSCSKPNAARKTGNNPLSDMNDWADLMLTKLRDGIMSLPPEIPLITDEEGNVESPILFGHTRNNGWFL